MRNPAVSDPAPGRFILYALPFPVLYPPVGPSYLCAMNVFDAIKEMRRLTKEGIPFSFSFMSFNSSRGTSEGVVHVNRARLRKRERAEHHLYADMVEAYLDLDTMEPRRFYQPLLMTFNGQKLTL